MKLPVLSTPIYDVDILSQEKPIKVRPFSVKEQKLMMMAVEANDLESTVKSIKQIITNCVIDPLDVDALPTVDVEWLFLNLRARSMGEVLNLYFKCKNQVLVPHTSYSSPDGTTGGITLAHNEECGMIIEVDVNVLDAKIINKDINKKIMLNDSVGVMMRYPALSLINEMIANQDKDLGVEIIASCIDYVFDTDGVYYSKDATKEEMNAFVDSMSTDKFELLEKFVEETPKVRFETKQVCGKCKYEHDFVLEGLQEFFR